MHCHKSQSARVAQKSVAFFVYELYHVKNQSLSKEKGLEEKRLHTAPKETRRELQKVADELGLPLNDCCVYYEWSERGNSWNKRISDEIIAKLYFPIKTPSNKTLSLKTTYSYCKLICDTTKVM